MSVSDNQTMTELLLDRLCYGTSFQRVNKITKELERIAPWDIYFKPPKFRRMREVHARRARKLRRRGEYVHFLRWEHGHCIYGWGGPVPNTFTIRIHPANQRSA